MNYEVVESFDMHKNRLIAKGFGLNPRMYYVKYESSITYHSRAMANVNVFADKRSDERTDGQTDKLYAPDLSMRDIKNDTLYISKKLRFRSACIFNTNLLRPKRFALGNCSIYQSHGPVFTEHSQEHSLSSSTDFVNLNVTQRLIG